MDLRVIDVSLLVVSIVPRGDICFLPLPHLISHRTCRPREQATAAVFLDPRELVQDWEFPLLRLLVRCRSALDGTHGATYRIQIETHELVRLRFQGPISPPAAPSRDLGLETRQL